MNDLDAVQLFLRRLCQIAGHPIGKRACRSIEPVSPRKRHLPLIKDYEPFPGLGIDSPEPRLLLKLAFHRSLNIDGSIRPDIRWLERTAGRIDLSGIERCPRHPAIEESPIIRQYHRRAEAVAHRP